MSVDFSKSVDNGEIIMAQVRENERRVGVEIQIEGENSPQWLWLVDEGNDGDYDYYQKVVIWSEVAHACATKETQGLESLNQLFSKGRVNQKLRQYIWAFEGTTPQYGNDEMPAGMTNQFLNSQVQGIHHFIFTSDTYYKLDDDWFITGIDFDDCRPSQTVTTTTHASVQVATQATQKTTSPKATTEAEKRFQGLVDKIVKSTNPLKPDMVISPDTLAIWNEEREDFIHEYRTIHQGQQVADQEGPYINPQVVVIHHTATENTKATIKNMRKTELSGRPDLKEKNGYLNTGAHFLVDRDGTITLIVPPELLCRHTKGMNHNAIGIENMGNTAELNTNQYRVVPYNSETDEQQVKDSLTFEQAEANVAIIKWLESEYGIKAVIPHSEYNKYPNYIDQRKKGYINYQRSGKVDPGTEFFSYIQNGISHLRLQTTPQQTP